MDAFIAWLFSSPPAAWIQAFGTPLIGLVAAYIALQGARTARNKLKYDMFEKRLQTYRELSTLISEAKSAGWFSFPLMSSFRQLQAQARFLFSDGAIDSHLEAVSSHLFSLIPELTASDPPPEEEDELQLHRRGTVIWWRFGQSPNLAKSRKELERESPWLSSIDWLVAHESELDNLTLPYLRLSH